jgi:nitrogenase molybdenum-iron protein alpha chain
VNFIGAEATAKSLRKIAQYYEDETLKHRVEEVIEEEMAAVRTARDEVFPRTQGKTAMLFVGGSRAHHYQDIFKEIGVKTIAAGYEFAHRDDYEGRRVLPNIKVDADSRNITELEVTQDETRYRPRKSEEEMKSLLEQGVTFKEYEGMIPDMEKDSLVIDDISHFETEKLIDHYKPDIFCAGIKEKYVIQKAGVPLKQLHSYDYGGPYAGFKGAVNFYHEIDRMINSRVWSYLTAPWQKNPELSAKYAWD